MLGLVCKLIGHKMSRRYLSLIHGGDIMVVKCKRCGFTKTTEISEALETKIVEVFS